MSRQIMCRKCGDDYKLHPEDARDGWKMRKAHISCVKPEGHGLTINGEFRPLDEIVCDLCGETVTGQIVVAVTMSPPGREIGYWEPEYGTVLNAESVAVHDALVKGGDK